MLAILICYDIEFETHLSCLATQETCIKNGIDLRITPVYGVRYVPAARSQAVHAFLQSDATHLFFIDSDMEWQARDFMRFLALGSKAGCVYAAYPHRRDPLDFMVSVSEPLDGDNSVATNEWGCIPMRGSPFKGAGLGFSVIQRGVLERMAKDAPRLIFPSSAEPIACVFDTDAVDGKFRGEDIRFFAQADQLGEAVWLDPSVALGHVGKKIFRGRMADHLKLTAQG